MRKRKQPPAPPAPEIDYSEVFIRLAAEHIESWHEAAARQARGEALGAK
jgi:hypothetical protein